MRGSLSGLTLATPWDNTTTQHIALPTTSQPPHLNDFLRRLLSCGPSDWPPFVETFLWSKLLDSGQKRKIHTSNVHKDRWRTKGTASGMHKTVPTAAKSEWRMDPDRDGKDECF